MKKIGIACDNYKIETFKRELNKAGFTEFTITPGPAPLVSLISVEVEEKDVKEVAKICKRVELGFKQSN